MRKGVFWFTLVAIVVSLVLLLPAGCGGGGPAQAKEVRIGLLGGLTGAPASAVVPLMEETEYFLRYINEVEGGISGVKLSWRAGDTKGTPDGGVIAYKELRDGFSPVLYSAVEDYIFPGIIDTIVQDKAVMLSWSALDSRLYVPPGRFFSVGIPLADGFGGYIKWVKENWKGSAPPKVGVLHWDRPSGLQWKVAEGWVKKQGVELVPVAFPITAMDLQPQLLTLRDAKVDHIWVAGISANAAVMIRDARGLGLAGRIPITFNEFAEPNVVLSIAGAAAEGFLQYRAEGPYSDNSEAAKYYTKVWKWAKNEDKWSDNRIVVSLISAIKAAIKQAIADVGVDNLNNEAIYNALNKMSKIDTMGNMEGFGYGTDRRVGVSTMKMSQYTKTGTTAISNWIQLPRIFEGIDK